MIAATVSGRIGKDAEMRQAGSTNVVSFSLASSAYRKSEKQTDWVRVSMFGKRAESLAQYLTKGAFVIVRGDLYVREYESGGEKKFSIEVKADDIELGGGKSQDGGGSSRGGGGGTSRQQSTRSEQAPPVDDFGGPGGDDGDVPF